MNKPQPKYSSDRPNSYPPWAPRIWSGLRPRDYWRLLSENRFQIHPTRYPMTVLVGLLSLWNSGLHAIQKLSMNAKVTKTAIDRPPIFIIGHWRSGTTLLHELMSRDSNLAFPTNFDAFVPHHFLISSPVVRPLLKMLLPGKRPMDDMSVNVDSPQEDDFAIMLLGGPTQYRRMGFPRNQNEYFRFLDCANLEQPELEKLESTLRYFLQAVTLKYGKQLVLKSPPHTGRIKCLARWFPGAKFVHMSRHPHQIVPSTMRLWKIADDVHAFQKPRYSEEELLAYVNKCQKVLYCAYNRDRVLLAENQLAEVTFEQLTADPVQTIKYIYEELELGGVGDVMTSTQSYFEQRKSHRKNRHEIEGIVDEIDSNWSSYMQQFGYL